MSSAEHDHPVDPQGVEAARRALAAEKAERPDLLGLLAEPVRQRVIRVLLAVDELYVGDLAPALNVSEDSISYATRVLRDAGVVGRRTAGRYGYYRLADGPLREVIVAVFSQLGDHKADTRP